MKYPMSSYLITGFKAVTICDSQHICGFFFGKSLCRRYIVRNVNTFPGKCNNMVLSVKHFCV